MIKEMMEMMELVDTIEAINKEIHSLYAFQWGQYKTLERTRQGLVRDLFTMAMSTGYRVEAKGESFTLIAPMR